MAQLLVGIVIFIIVFVLKVIMGAAAGALKGVEHTMRNDDFGRYTGQSSGGNNLLEHTSGADLIRKYRQLYEDDIISYEEYAMKREAILRSGTM